MAISQLSIWFVFGEMQVKWLILELLDVSSDMCFAHYLDFLRILSLIEYVSNIADKGIAL